MTNAYARTTHRGASRPVGPDATAALGYRLHTITTASLGSKGFGGGGRIQATIIFERL